MRWVPEPLKKWHWNIGQTEVPHSSLFFSLRSLIWALFCVGAWYVPSSLSFLLLAWWCSAKQPHWIEWDLFWADRHRTRLSLLLFFVFIIDRGTAFFLHFFTRRTEGGSDTVFWVCKKNQPEGSPSSLRTLRTLWTQINYNTELHIVILHILFYSILRK